MLRLSEIEALVEEQRSYVQKRAEHSIARTIESKLVQPVAGFARIISGIRRCGKSTLVYRLMMQLDKPHACLYLNFDTPKLFPFTVHDFSLIDRLLQKQPSIKHLFFDEIQLIEGWESYIRQKIDEGFYITITGSNAHMLSKELGTRLTGRHIPYQLFPFSYAERLELSGEKSGAQSFRAYLQEGGFPMLIGQPSTPTLSTLVEDILYRDIAVRYGIREIQSLKNLVSWLGANSSKLLTATKLKHLIDVNSVSTVTEYLHYLEQSYLIQLLQRFSWKEKNIIRSPRKSYLADPALIQAVSIPTKPNWGQRLELVVFNALRAQLEVQEQVFYWQKTHEAECDFLVKKGSFQSNESTSKAYQVCYELNAENESREVEGLYQVMQRFNVSEAQIITCDQEDRIHYKGVSIEVVPGWRWCASRN